ncbi:SH3 domain-binding protein 5b [Nothobranchius furzeri]|uniref:SH3 domain-binding protein 5 n=3 Tax=Nothobranchius TaxID=28779 RepID=A0A1A7ZLC0_NOTFU|nr:SH3-domain binding protein 5 [Nothobranchius furzeri]
MEKEHRSDDEGDYEEEEVDPRIQGELEKLNQSTDDINRCEIELEDGRQKFRSVLVEATVKLDELVKKIGKPVEESKPYWEARRLARQAQLEAQKASQDFHRATEVLRAAKETISLAEQRLLEEDNRQFDSAWQEMLNHATQRVMEAEHTKTRSELLHKETAVKYSVATGCMKQLEKKLKRTISKSRPYFEMKAKFYLQLENLKKNVDDRQAKLTEAKCKYKTALRNLEMISDEIHERRRSSIMGPRGPGVGAEGDAISGDEISSFRMESDEISMASECFDDEPCSGGSLLSEEDSETRSTCSLGSTPSSPQELLSPCPFVSSSSSGMSSSSSPSPTPSSSSSTSSPALLSRPCSLDLPSTVSLSDFGLISPVLGPRSECSGASSPECDLERGDRAEGAEEDLDNTPAGNNNSTSTIKKTFSLESRFSFLNLRRPRVKDSCSQKAETGQPVVLVKGV